MSDLPVTPPTTAAPFRRSKYAQWKRSLAFGSMLLLAGCDHMGRGASTGGTEFAGGNLCTAFHPLQDLHAALATSSEFAMSSELFELVDADEELAAVARANRRLKEVSGRDARDLEEKIARLSTMMAARREVLGEALEKLEASYANAEALVDRAALCKNVDQRDPSAPAGSKPPFGQDDGRGEDVRAPIRKANIAVLASASCQSSVRLWASVRQLELTSEVSSASVAAHLTELTLDKEHASVRDRLVVSLREHAAALAKYRVLASPKAEKRSAEDVQRLALRSEILTELESTRRSCVASMRVTGRVVGASPEPRRATVVVRPTWPAVVESLPGTGAVLFGSGFVVRWKTADGKVETRIVTNNHVMSGAYEAEIFPGAPELASTTDDRSSKEHGWKATLIEANPYDDVAVLRLDAQAESVFRQGLSFRFDAAEEEQSRSRGIPRCRHTPFISSEPRRRFECSFRSRDVGCRRDARVPATHGSNRLRE